MMRKKIYELMDMFPYFFDKSESSNFFKSQSVTNNQLLKVYQSLMENVVFGKSKVYLMIILLISW